MSLYRRPTRREWRRSVWRLRNSVPYRLLLLAGVLVSPSLGPKP